jgi:hypothetical protein
MNPKAVTVEQAEAMREKAVDFLARINGEDPNDIAGMSTAEYAEHKHLRLVNPKAAAEITDRAKRYRAQKKIKGPRKCELCGSKRFLVADHRNGNEANGNAGNLRWLCKSCNNREGAKKIKAGRGVRTRQYNPGAKTLGAYAAAAAEHTRGRHDAGGAVIHDTPKSARSRYAKQIWALRRQHGNPDSGLVDGRELFASFHGAPAEKVRELQLKTEVERDYVYLGELTGGRFLQSDGHEVRISFEGDGVKLCSSPDGHQLYCIGGNQSLESILRDTLGADTSKALASIGRFGWIYYIAAKSATNHEPREWEHPFGLRAESVELLQQAAAAGWSNGEFQKRMSAALAAVPLAARDLPEGWYDTVNKRILIAGGSYYVDWPGIVG